MISKPESGKLLSIAIEAALCAGREILEVYYSNDFATKIKHDNTPLTLADQRAHVVINDMLNATGLPVLSEEGQKFDYEERRKWEYFWLVDPLDGTKEFIRRNGEFTVNIALIHKQNPVIGVIYVPVLEDMYFASKVNGAYKLDCINYQSDKRSLPELISISRRLPASGLKQAYTIVASRSHLTNETEDFINLLKKEHSPVSLISKGSSLKICLVAEGMADIYSRFAPTMEWDTAAGHAIAESAGCTVTGEDGITPLIYNKQDLFNPWFIIKAPGKPDEKF